MDWFQIGKGGCQGCVLSPCLFNLYTEYIMRKAGLDEAQARIKIARRNINNLRYADDTTLMVESEGELKEPRDEGERGVKKPDSTFKKLRSWQIDGETMEPVADFVFLGFKITAGDDCLLFGRKAMTNLDSILKNRDITLPTKVHIVKKPYGFLISHIQM